MVAVRPLSAPDGTRSAEDVYRVFKSAPHVPTPLINRGRLFLWDDKGVVTAADAATGKVIWQKRVGGTYFSSPVCVAGRLYNIDVTGKVFVLGTGDEPQVLARNSLPEGGRATPAVGGGMLLVRTTNRLYAIGRTASD